MKAGTRIAIALFCSAALACSGSGGVGQDGNSNNDPVRKRYLEWIARGKDAVPDLKKAVKSDTWRVRSHATLAMGRTGEKSLAPLVMDILKKDDNMAVRNCAVIALGDLKAKEAVPYLVSLLGMEGREARSSGASKTLVIKSLGKIGDPAAVEPLFEQMLKRGHASRLAAVEAIIKIGDPGASRLVLKRAEDIKERGAERFASRILGELPVQGSEAYLLEQARARGLQQRIAAAIALGRIKSEKAVPYLIDNLKENHRLLQKQSADALISVNSGKAVDPLIAFFPDSREYVAMSAAYVLAGMKRPGIPLKVFNAMKKSMEVNGPAAHVLGRKKYTRAAPLIRFRLARKELRGQNEMAVALGWMGDRSAVPLLIKVARREGLEGSVGAIWSLGQLRARAAVPVLLELMERDDERITHHIISALGSIGDRRAVVKLIDFQYGTRKKYAKIIGMALGKIGGPGVVNYIKDNIESDDPVQIMAAGSALLRIKSHNMVPYAMNLVRKGNPRARKYAARYIQKKTGRNLTDPKELKKWASQKGFSSP